MRITNIFLFILTFLMLASCRYKAPDAGKQALLEVDGLYLYKEDLEKVIPPNISVADSTEIADNFIRKWVTNSLMYENAKRNTSNEVEIDKMVEEYRKSLIIHQYEERLIEQRLRKTPSDEELREFYKQYSEHMVLKESVIKGLLLIVPENAPMLNNVRTWVKSGNTNALENIEKYSLQNAISYDYFYDNWLPISEVLRQTPIQLTNADNFVSSTPFYETTDGTNRYFLRIQSYLLAGKQEPYELVKDKLANILQIKYKNDFITEFENELYNDAIKNESVKYLTKTSKKQAKQTK